MKDRHHRTEDRNQSWNRQSPRLVDTYMKYQANGIPSEDELEGQEWRIRYMDFEVMTESPGIRSVCNTDTANETLARFGALGGSPDQPDVAFPSKFLEGLRQIHRVCSRFRIHGLSRVITNIHGRFPTPTLEDQLRVAYDGYLAIQREVQCRVDSELGRDPHQHFIHHVRPPFLHVLKDFATPRSSIEVCQNPKEYAELLEKTITRYIQDALDSACKMKNFTMQYERFDHLITGQYGVIIEGWPANLKFHKPSSFHGDTNTNKLLKLQEAWKSGSAHFRKLTAEEWAAWKTVRAQGLTDGSIKVKVQVKRKDVGTKRPKKGEKHSEQTRRRRVMSDEESSSGRLE
ncbi:hypothetical protein AAF712_009716 [Marasmius tenuissimus]|uniref:Uncharacterized protein n=1 Tax=Marasmius tenuissimus TaxID=585030 RepID=A0ABR2ZP20_9AGAR